MKAIGIYKNLEISNPEAMVDVDIQKPMPTSRQLLVEVKSIAVNPVDTKVRLHKPIQSTPKILGWDVAGVVMETGDECGFYKPGDLVYYSGDVTKPGGNCQYHLIDERIVGNKPESLSFSESAAIPLTGITAYEGLFDRLRISKHSEDNKNKSILIIGAAGGVGSIALQLAKHVGLTVIGTASRTESIDWVKTMGADGVINHYEPFPPQLKALGLNEVDYIYCLNTTDGHWLNMVEVIKPQGLICGIVDTANEVNLNLLKPKSAGFVWEFMFTRSLFQTEDMIRQHDILNEISCLIDEGILKTTVGTVLSPINAANLMKAHELLESGKTIGKIVIEGFGD